MIAPMLSRILRQTWLPFLLGAVWWVASEGSTNFFFPSLREITTRLLRDLGNGTLLAHALFSLGNIAISLVIAIVLGVSAGILIGSWPRLRGSVWPLLNFIRAMPAVAFVPVILVAFGIGRAPQVFVISLACFWPILLNTLDGVRGMKPSILDTARAFRLPLGLVLFKVMLPAASPQIMAGIRVSLAVSLTLMVVSEFFSGNQGLGYYIQDGSERFQIASVWAGTIFIGLLGYAMSLLLLRVERVVLAWYFETSRKTAP